MRSRIFGALLVSFATACVASTAFAQDVATAATLFDKGVADMGASHFDAACPEIAESYRLDPRAGTLFTLAECYAKGGKTASAVARYQDYLDLFARMTPDQQGKQQGREKTAQDQKTKLTPDVPLLTLTLPPDAPSATEVKRDGNLLGGPSIGLPLPVDPGDHLVTTQEPGGPISTVTISIGKGEKKSVTLAVLAPDALPGPSGHSDGGGEPSHDDGSRRKNQLVAGLVVGGVGVLGLIVGGITGGLTVAKKSTIKNDCDLDAKTCRDPSGLDAVSSAHTTGLVSTVSFVVGGALTATGLVVVLTAPSARATAGSPRLGLDVGPGRLGFSGAFW